jgi:hypothetical protein
MSGTQSNLENSSTSVDIPEPLIRIVKGNDQTSGDHDKLWVGGLTDPEYKALQPYKPQIWLYRYKQGWRPKSGPNSGYILDNTRGYVHPSQWLGGAQVSGTKYSGGAHNTRGGGPIPDRQSEWDVTGAWRYDAFFEPEKWFLNSQTQAYAWPIQALAGATGDEHLTIGKSGQSGNDTGTFPRTDSHFFCDSSQTKGTQRQYFAFAYTIKPTKNSRNRIVGPLSQIIVADIWPRVKVNYGTCLPNFDRGRKIRLRHK